MEKIGAFRALMPIVLASASPRRKDLLDSLGIEYAIDHSQTPEDEPSGAETLAGYAVRQARLKALDVAGRNPASLILAADTVVGIGDRILGKPADEAEARRMLGQLSGREARVCTGVCLVPPGSDHVYDFSATSKVMFSLLSEEAIAAYAATGESLDKAGGFAINGLGAFMIVSVSGSHSNIIGLPLAETARALLMLKAVEVRGANNCR